MKVEKRELLEHYAEKKVNPFIQFDAFVFEPYNDPGGLTASDKDGDCLNSRSTYELMNSPFTVRVLVRPEAKKEDVVRTLNKILKWIKKEKLEFNF